MPKIIKQAELEKKHVKKRFYSPWTDMILEIRLSNGSHITIGTKVSISVHMIWFRHVETTTLHFQRLILIPLDPIECDHNLARSSIVSMFTEPYTLPSSHVETPIGDWNGQGTTKHWWLNMCWHVIRSFHGVPPWSRWTLWNNATKKCFSVRLDIRVIIFIDSKRSACVLHCRIWQFYRY
jgi:hypothetical protein